MYAYLCTWAVIMGTLQEPLEIMISFFCLNVAGRRTKQKTFTDLLNLLFIKMKNSFCDQLSWFN